jgi:SRSO17 transposase
MAALIDPMHASTRHQSRHHFVAQAEWSGTQMLRRVCQRVMPEVDFGHGGWRTIDEPVSEARLWPRLLAPAEN